MLKEEEEYPVIETNELEEVGLVDGNDMIEEKNHEDGEALVEIAIDLPDLQTQSAPISAAELFLAPQREDLQSNDRLSSFFDHPPTEIHQGFVDNRNAKIIAEELFPSKSMSRDVWDGSPIRGVNTQHFFAKEDTAASTKIYTHGEIVFTQADPHFPLWPAIVVDYEKLPEDIQNTLPKSGGTPKRKQKMPVYFYGRNDYDIIPVERLFDFQTHLEAYRQQEVDSSLQSAYLIGLSLAEEEVRRPVEERISWLLPNSPVPNDNAPLAHAISKSRSFDDHVSTTTYVLSDILEELLPPAGSAAAVASSRTLPSSEIISSNSNSVSLFDNVPNGGSDPFSFNPPVLPANSGLSPPKNVDDRNLESPGGITNDPPLESDLLVESTEAPITNAIQASRSTDNNELPVASIKDKAIIRDASSLFSSSSTSSANPFDLPPTTQAPPRTKPVTLERGPFENNESNSAVSSTKIKPKIVQSGANLFGNVTPADDPFGAPAAAIVKNTTSSVENTAKPKRTVPVTTAGGLFDNTAVTNDPFSSSTVAPPSTIPRATSAKNLNQTKVLPTAQSLFDSNPTSTGDVFSSFGVPAVAAAPVIPLAEKYPPVNIHPPVVSANDVFSSAPTSSSSDIGCVFNAPPAISTAPPLPTRGSLIPRITTPREPVKAKPAEVSPVDFFGGGAPATTNDPFSQSTASINQFEESKPQSITPPPIAVSVSAPPSVISPTSSGSSLVPTPRAIPETVSVDTPPTISVPNTVELKREISDPISEKGSSGKVGGAKLIKVKPQLASGSPFDSPTTSTGPTLFPSKDLFPPAANDPFAAIPAPAPAVHRKPSFDASNAFKNAPNAPPPAVSVHTAKSAARPVDPFGAPSRGKQVSAEDVFSKVPPPIQQPSSFDLPPAPPGVKVAPIVSPPSSSVGTPVSSGTNVGEDFASPTKTVAPAVKSKVKPKAHLMTAGGIPTPHGIVVPPTNNNAAAQAFDKPAVVPIVPVKSKQPIVNPQILTSLVEVVPEPVQVEEPVPVVEPPPQTTTVPQVPETRSNYRGGRYVKPASAIFSVGFGGKCVTMFPDINICPPTYISASQTDERRLRLLPLNRRPSVLKVRKLLSLFVSRLPSYEHIPGLSEMQQFKRLLETFSPSVPPVAEDPKKAKTGPATVATVDYSQFIQGFIQQPITSCLPKEWLLKYFSGQSMQDVVEQEKLLWSLLEVVLKHNGQLASAEGVSNPASPEKEIISLLLQRDPSHPAVLLPDAASPNVVTKFTSFTSEQRGQYYNRLQTLLVEGNRDDALNFSIEQQDWTTAMMLASITGPQKYQEVIRLYSQSNFISGHPLHFMMMIYSNQANKSLVQSASKNLPKFIHTVNPADAANKFNAAQQEEALFKSWKTTLAGILANKTSDWEQLVHLLGYRLQQDYKNLFGAHFAYLCANALPSDPREKATPFPTLTNESLAANDLDFNKLRDFPLVGSSFSDKLARVMSDSLSIMALRMTEVLEHALEKSLTASSSSSAPSSDSGNADNKSGGGFFGWIGGGSGKASSDKGKAEELSKDKKEIADKLLRLRVIMSPFKIRFALQLAEFGLTSAASSYVQQALSLVREVTALEDPKNTAKKPSVPILPFAKKFIEALEDLADRLGVKNKGYNAAVNGGVASTSSAPPTAATASSGGSGWGLSSVLSAASLKDFVDGPQPVPGVANPPRTNNNGPPTAARAPPPMMPSNTNPAYPQGPPMQSGPPQAYNRHPSSGNFNNPAYPGGRAPQTNPAPSAFPPQPSHIAASNPGYPLPAPASNSSVNSSGFVEVEIDDNTASVFNNQPSTTAPPYNAYNAYPGNVTQVPPAGPSNVFNPNPAPVNAGPTTTAPSSSSNNAAVAAAQKKIRQRASQNPHLMAANQPEASPKVISSPWGMNAASTNFQGPESNNIPNNPQATKAQSGTPPVSYHPSNNPAAIPSNPASIPPNAGSVPPSATAPNNQNSNNSGVSVNPAIAADAPAPKVSTPTKNTPPVSGNGANTLSAPTTGIVSNLRKGIIGWFYPDAHDATENIGKSLEAYYDDKLGRWIFPGEDNTVADAALKPPPTGPMPSSQPSSSSSSLPGMDQQKPPEPSEGGGGGGGGYDPLAALMAPPSRSVRPPSSSYGNPPTASDDPLAAMMAPRFTSFNAAGGPPGSGTPSTSSTPPVSSAGGPPPLGGGGGGAGPPKYNVWKPKPAENASYASNPDVNSLMNQYQAQSAPLPSTTDNTTTTLPPVTAVTSEPPSGDSGMMTEISLDGEGPPPTNGHYIPPYAMNTNMNNNAYNDDAYANLG